MQLFSGLDYTSALIIIIIIIIITIIIIIIIIIIISFLKITIINSIH